MLQKIEEIKKQFETEISKVKAHSDIEELRIKFLGRKGIISNTFSLLSEVPAEIKPQFGQGLNQLKKSVEHKIKETASKIEQI